MLFSPMSHRIREGVVNAKIMTLTNSSVAILADRHLNMVEGVRGFLETAFSDVFVVADTNSLLVGAKKLKPGLIVFDLSVCKEPVRDLIGLLREASQESRLIVLTTHEQAAAATAFIDAGVDAVILKHSIARDLMAGIDAVQQGGRFVSPGIAQ